MKRPITKQYEHTEILIIHSRPRWTCPLPRHRNHYSPSPPPPTSSITRANAKNFAHRLSESTGIRWRLSKKLAIISLKNILNVSDGILIADRRLNDAPSNFVSFVIILILSTVPNFSYFPPNFNVIAFHSILPLTTLLLFFLCLFMLLFSLSFIHKHTHASSPPFFFWTFEVNNYSTMEQF